MNRWLTLGALAVLACSSSGSDTTGSTKKKAEGGECGAILDACHMKDDGNPGIANDCHQLSHTLDDEQCVQRVIECVNTCTALPCPPGGCGPGYDAGTAGGGHGGGSGGTAGGHGGGAGTTGGTGGTGTAGSAGTGTGPSAECVAYCDCIPTCSNVSGYPFSGTDDCLTQCASFTAAEVTCWSNYCEDAAAASSGKDHACEHAWGAFGLGEC